MNRTTASPEYYRNRLAWEKPYSRSWFFFRGRYLEALREWRETNTLTVVASQTAGKEKPAD